MSGFVDTMGDVALSDQDVKTIQGAVGRLQANRPREAEQMCRSVLDRQADSVHALSVLGRALFEQNRFDEASEAIERCIDLDANPTPHRQALGRVHLVQGRLDEAERVFNAILEQGDDPTAASGLADVLLKSGRHDEAFGLIQYYMMAGLATPVMGYVQVAVLVRRDDLSGAEEAAERTMSQWPEMDRSLKQQMLKHLARAMERADEFARAFDLYEQAASASPGRFSRDQFAQWLTDIRARCTAAVLREAPEPTVETDLPVFVLGMPRSGTTLVERIIAAHPDAHGGGELPYVSRLIEQPLRDTAPTAAAMSGYLTQDRIDDTAAAYTTALRQCHPTAKRIVDKNLGMYRYAGLLGVLFPQAKFIHCVREPVNNCFAIWTAPFDSSRIRYSTDLEDTAFAYRAHIEMMAYWRDAAPDLDILEVSYESMVANQQEMTQRIIAHLGLPWDDRCLRYYEHTADDDSRAASPTVSHDQVRKPIFTTSLDRAAAFGDRLDPLRRALGDLV